MDRPSSQEQEIICVLFSLPLYLLYSSGFFPQNCLLSVLVYRVVHGCCQEIANVCLSSRQWIDYSRLLSLRLYSKHKEKNLIGAINFGQGGEGLLIVWSGAGEMHE